MLRICLPVAVLGAQPLGPNLQREREVRHAVGKAAEHVGVSEKTVRGWVADVAFPHFRLGASGSRGKIAIA